MNPTISTDKKLVESEPESCLEDDEPTTPSSASPTARDGLSFKLSKSQLKSLFSENNDEKLSADIDSVKYALDLFLNSQFTESETFLRKRFGISLWVDRLVFNSFYLVYVWLRYDSLSQGRDDL